MKGTWSVILFVLTIGLTVKESIAGCEGLSDDENIGYEIIQGSYQFESAVELCQQYGGQLARIQNTEQQEAVEEIVRSTDQGDRVSWIGRISEKGKKFTYPDKTAASDFERWSPSVDATDQTKDRCGVIGENDAHPGLWTAKKCAPTRLSAMCEFQKLPEDYDFFLAESDSKISFEDAKKLCTDRGAELAEFESLQDYEPLKFPIAKSGKIFFFGYEMKGGNWKTMKGKSVEDKSMFGNSQLKDGCAANQHSTYHIIAIDCKLKMTAGAVCMKSQEDSTKSTSNKIYYIKEKRGTYDALRGLCSEDGGQIAKITSQEDQKYVLKAMSKVTGIFNTYYFHPMKVSQDRKSFVWSDDNKKVDFHLFGGDPLSSLSANKRICPFIEYNRERQGVWQLNKDCNSAATGLLCYKDATADDPFNVDVKVTIDANIKTVKTFKLIESTSKTYYEWQAACKEAGMELATIDNGHEQLTVSTLLVSKFFKKGLIAAKRSAMNRHKFINPGGRSLKYTPLIFVKKSRKSCVSVSAFGWSSEFCHSSSAICQKIEIQGSASQGGHGTGNQGGSGSQGQQGNGAKQEKVYQIFGSSSAYGYDFWKSYCEQKGGKLPEPRSGEENLKLLAAIKAITGQTYVLLGAHRKFGGLTTSNYEWSDGTLLQSSFKNWQFIIYAGLFHYCAVINIGTGQWKDSRCSDTYRQVACELKKAASTESSEQKEEDNVKFEVHGSSSSFDYHYWKNYCKQQHGKLPEPRSITENLKLMPALRSVQNQGRASVPLGAERSTVGFTLKDYKWSDGTVIESSSFKNWKVALLAGLFHKCSKVDTGSGQWSDSSCSDKYDRAICEIPKATTTTSEQNKPSTRQIRKKFYEIHGSTTSYNYDHWKSYCQRIGGKLPEPRNAGENLKLVSAIKPLASQGTVLLGAHRNSNGFSFTSFQWSDGTRLKDKTYRNWKFMLLPGYFNRCVKISVDTGLWNDVKCGDTYQKAACEVEKMVSVESGGQEKSGAGLKFTVHRTSEKHNYNYWKSYCQQQHGKLPEPRSAAENLELLPALQNVKAQARDWVPLGATRSSNGMYTDNYKWSDGKNVDSTYKNWQAKLFTGLFNRCSKINTATGQWTDSSCNDKYDAGICEVIGTPE